MNQKKHHRFFVSYSKVDEEVARSVVTKTLRDLGHQVKEMRDLEGGAKWRYEIRQWIDWSHFVISVITKKSSRRAWIHQEIGYALGRHVPVIPIVYKTTLPPLAFLDDFHCIVANSPFDLEAELREMDWAKIISKLKPSDPFPVSECDNNAEKRSELLTKTAEEIRREFPRSQIRIRQRSRLSSFSVPRDCHAEPWTSVKNLELELFWLKPKERIAMQKFADRGGCDLMLDPDYYEYADGRNWLSQRPPHRLVKIRPGYNPYVQRARLITLCDFLQNKRDSEVRVVVENGSTSSASITIIGDHWFTSSAGVAPFGKSRKTISTWHAPTVGWQCEEFDTEFETTFNEQEKKLEKHGQTSSRLYAISRIQAAIAKVEKQFRLRPLPH